MITDFKYYYNKYVDSRASHNEMKKEFRDMLSAIFDSHKSIKQIIFCGETPSFNDGDPCTHSESVILVCTDGVLSDGYALEAAYNDWDSTMECYDLKEEDIGNYLLFPGEEEVLVKMPIKFKVSKKMSYKNNYGHPKPEGMEKVLKLLDLQNLSSDIYDTNYIVVVEKIEDDLKIEHHNYWPGY